MHQLGEVLVWWAACLGVWLLTLSSVTLPETLVAAGCALPCAVLALVARRAVRGSWPVPFAWSRWLLPLPAAIAADGVRVLGRAAGVLAGRRVPPGEQRTVSLPHDRDAGYRHTRQAVATTLVSAAPGTVVIDVDEETDELHLHALGSGPPSMEEVVRR